MCCVGDRRRTREAAKSHSLINPIKEAFTDCYGAMEAEGIEINFMGDRQGSESQR